MKKHYQQPFILLVCLSCLGLTTYADQHQSAVQHFNASMPPLLTTEQLSQTAMQCRNDIVQLHQQRATIPREKVRDYSIALGLAADKCDAIIHVFHEVQKATQDYTAYQNHLQKVQGLASTTGTTSSEYSVDEAQPYYVSPSTRSQKPIVDTSSTSPNNPVYQPLGEN